MGKVFYHLWKLEGIKPFQFVRFPLTQGCQTDLALQGPEPHCRAPQGLDPDLDPHLTAEQAASGSHGGVNAAVACSFHHQNIPNKALYPGFQWQAPLLLTSHPDLWSPIYGVRCHGSVGWIWPINHILDNPDLIQSYTKRNLPVV